MSIDLGRELTVRCIAHNVGRQYPTPLLAGSEGYEQEATDYALRMARIIDPAHAEALSVAAIALWRVGFGTRSGPIHAAMSGLQPEEDPAHD
jgi:hypothetical protein